MKEQGNKCGLCSISFEDIPTRDICLDHCHKSGIVRAALCRNCNGIEGKIFNLANRGKRGRTPEDFLSRVLRYWDTHSEVKAGGVFHPSHKTSEEQRILRNKKARLARARKKAIKNVEGK